MLDIIRHFKKHKRSKKLINQKISKKHFWRKMKIAPSRKKLGLLDADMVLFDTINACIKNNNKMGAKTKFPTGKIIS